MDGVPTPERAVDTAAYQLAPLESLRHSPQLKNKALLFGQDSDALASR
jgi:hypothetical protein